METTSLMVVPELTSFMERLGMTILKVALEMIEYTAIKMMLITLSLHRMYLAMTSLKEETETMSYTEMEVMIP